MRLSPPSGDGFSPAGGPSTIPAPAGAASPLLATGEWLAAMQRQFPQVSFQDWSTAPRCPCQAISSPPLSNRCPLSFASSNLRSSPARSTDLAVHRHQRRHQRPCGQRSLSTSSCCPCHRACHPLTKAPIGFEFQEPNFSSSTSAAVPRQCLSDISLDSTV